MKWKREKGDIPLKREGATGRFKHTEVNCTTVQQHNMEYMCSGGKMKQ